MDPVSSWRTSLYGGIAGAMVVGVLSAIGQATAGPPPSHATATLPPRCSSVPAHPARHAVEVGSPDVAAVLVQVGDEVVLHVPAGRGEPPLAVPDQTAALTCIVSDSRHHGGRLTVTLLARKRGATRFITYPVGGCDAHTACFGYFASLRITG